MPIFSAGLPARTLPHGEKIEPQMGMNLKPETLFSDLDSIQ
jgi:hypothetical protein